MASRVGVADLKSQEERLSLCAQTWFHAYILVQVLARRKEDRRSYDLAAWMRHFASTIGGPNVLTDLPSDTFARLCRYYLPPNFDPRSARETVARLHETSKAYDDLSLLAEITSMPGTRGNISTTNTAGLNNVPALEVSLPLSENDLDTCLRLFLLFASWPRPRPFAWARFANINPPENADHLQCMTIFYRADDQTFSLAGRHASQRFDPNIYFHGLTLEDIAELGSVVVLSELQSS